MSEKGPIKKGVGGKKIVPGVVKPGDPKVDTKKFVEKVVPAIQKEVTKEKPFKSGGAF